MSRHPDTAFKIVDAADWARMQADGHYSGSAVDLADGYVHMSTADQLNDTLRKHYAGRRGLVELTVDLMRLDDLRWEPSRGGDLFPHLYGPLPLAAVVASRAFDTEA